MSDRKAEEIEIEEGIGIEEVPEDGFEVEEVVQGEFIGQIGRASCRERV